MADYPKRLYHPDLGREIEAADPGQEAVYAESGWIEVDEPPEPLPGYQAEPTRYVQGDDGKFHPSHLMAEPEPEPEPVPKARRKPAAKPADEDS